MSLEPTRDRINPVAGRRPAAVLMLIRPLGEEAEPHLTFIRRSEKVRTHKGQVSFPGGSFSPEDEVLEQTALRETHEELGIEPVRLQVLGPLAPVDTVVSNFMIYPFVAVPKEPFQELVYVPDDFEVAGVLEIPLRQLIHPGSLQEEEWVMRGKPRKVFFYNYRQTVIWGATAFILRNFIAEINAGKWQILFDNPSQWPLPENPE
ncbi:MAG TPA: CoA pyrophosphatase [Chloroflexia bacterium]|nr:CoA pyrophosphatase [Chloroflexia bacterium]